MQELFICCYCSVPTPAPVGVLLNQQFMDSSLQLEISAFIGVSSAAKKQKNQKDKPQITGIDADRAKYKMEEEQTVLIWGNWWLPRL
ncbi:MAG TPA: hypothetical protein VGJ36_06710 [Gemmatimonadales bacterium]